MKRKEHDVLDGAIDLFRLAIFPDALGLSDGDPIGCLVAGSGKFLGIHKCFQQVDWVPVDFQPVFCYSPGDFSENMGRQVWNLNPG